MATSDRIVAPTSKEEISQIFDDLTKKKNAHVRKILKENRQMSSSVRRKVDGWVPSKGHRRTI